MQRLNNFDKHIAERKEKRRSEAGHLQDLEDELIGLRKLHMEAVNEHGSLKAEEKVIRYFMLPHSQACIKRVIYRLNRVEWKNEKPSFVPSGRNTI